MSEKTGKTVKKAAQIAELESAVAAQGAEISRLQQKLERMNELLLEAQRARFGRSSEKRSYVLEEGAAQLNLFDEAEVEQNPKAVEPTAETLTVAAHARKKKRTIDELVADLPVDEIVLELSDGQKICSKCGGAFLFIGKKLVHRELCMIPQQTRLVAYYSCSYACADCEKKTGFSHIVTTQTPPTLMKHSLASPSTVADVMTKKYVDGLPLARQEKIWKRLGVELSRATLANWVIQTTQTWLKPLYRQMKKQLLTQTIIHADETVVQVLREPDKAATAESRMWVYASSPRGGKPLCLFEYQPSRSGAHPKAFLSGFKGWLVTDGYAGYSKVDGVTRCGCWAHARRKWREAMPQGVTVKTSKAAIGFEYCNKLFAYEKKIAAQNGEQRHEARQTVLKPLLDAYWLWLETLHPESGSKLESAVRYSQNQRPFLCAFLGNGDVEISNNPAENAIRPFAVGCKNWLFCDSVKGADSSAIVYTIVETAKANGIEPYAYLLRVLSFLPYWGRNPSYAQLDTLMPWHPDMKKSLETALPKIV